MLGEQIVVIFLMMAIGYVIVKTGFFQVEDSKVLSNLVIYICFPCVMIDSFQIELTQRTAAGLAIAVVVAAAAHLFMIVVVWLLGKPLGFNRIEKVSIIYTNAGYLVIPLVSSVLMGVLPAKAAGVLSRPFRLIPVTGWKRGCLGAMPDSEQRWYRG